MAEGYEFKFSCVFLRFFMVFSLFTFFTVSVKISELSFLKCWLKYLLHKKNEKNRNENFQTKKNKSHALFFSCFSQNSARELLNNMLSKIALPGWNKKVFRFFFGSAVMTIFRLKILYEESEFIFNSVKKYVKLSSEKSDFILNRNYSSEYQILLINIFSMYQ